MEDNDELRVAAWDGAKWIDLEQDGYTVNGNVTMLKSAVAASFPVNPFPFVIGFKSPGYAVLAKKADGGYYRTYKGKLYFTIDGEYNQGNLSYKVYDKQRTLISLPVSPTLRKVDDNRYVLNVTSLSAGYYELIVTNEKNEALTLKFKK